ncbi:hypothetical protein, partial [Klebsiella pneumoniae]
CFRGILWFSHKIAPYSVGCPTFGVQSSSAAGQSRRLHFVSGLGRPSGRLFYVASRHEPPKQLINLANT